jgi:hypothetical protein
MRPLRLYQRLFGGLSDLTHKAHYTKEPLQGKSRRFEGSGGVLSSNQKFSNNHRRKNNPAARAIVGRWREGAFWALGLGVRTFSSERLACSVFLVLFSPLRQGNKDQPPDPTRLALSLSIFNRGYVSESAGYADVTGGLF